ncbi:hypothetical protein Scel_62460 [Streptomyces cellostaticus]|nr:hypothetical protein Scel_62460 [Streptomyces cellostaticus]
MLPGRAFTPRERVPCGWRGGVRTDVDHPFTGARRAIRVLFALLFVRGPVYALDLPEPGGH